MAVGNLVSHLTAAPELWGYSTHVPALQLCAVFIYDNGHRISGSHARDRREAIQLDINQIFGQSPYTSETTCVQGETLWCFTLGRRTKFNALSIYWGLRMTKIHWVKRVNLGVILIYGLLYVISCIHVDGSTLRGRSSHWVTLNE